MALQALARFWPLFGVGEAFRGRPKGCSAGGGCVCSEHSSGEVNGKGSPGAVASQRSTRVVLAWSSPPSGCRARVLASIWRFAPREHPQRGKALLLPHGLHPPHPNVERMSPPRRGNGVGGGIGKQQKLFIFFFSFFLLCPGEA